MRRGAGKVPCLILCSALCRKCINKMLAGSVVTKKDGSEQVKFTQFYEALLEAKGISFNGTSCMGKEGRTLSYKAKVQGNGNLLVGMACTAMLERIAGANACSGN